jgi:phosphatidylglycerol:prolipoprotein diacylglycerol transferase
MTPFVHPVLFTLDFPWGGELVVGSFGALIAIIAVFGAWLSSRNAAAVGMTRDDGLDLALCLAFGGIIGSKVLQAIVEHEAFLADPVAFLSFKEVGVMQGALIGAIAVVVLRARAKGWSVPLSLDVLAPSWAIGHGVLRVGCFLAGCCYGVPSSFGVRFPSDSAAYRSLLLHDPALLDGGTTVPLFPVQLLEAAFEVTVGLVALKVLRARRMPEGFVSLAWLTVYSAFRFGAEWLRADPERGTGPFGLVSTTQALAALLFAAGVFGLTRVVRRP